MVQEILLRLQEPQWSGKVRFAKTVNSEAKEANSPSRTGSLSWVWHLTFHCGLSPSQLQQKHWELPNRASCYQNTTKRLTHISIIMSKENNRFKIERITKFESNIPKRLMIELLQWHQWNISYIYICMYKDNKDLNNIKM